MEEITEAIPGVPFFRKKNSETKTPSTKLRWSICFYHIPHFSLFSSYFGAGRVEPGVGGSQGPILVLLLSFRARVFFLMSWVGPSVLSVLGILYHLGKCNTWYFFSILFLGLWFCSGFFFFFPVWVGILCILSILLFLFFFFGVAVGGGGQKREEIRTYKSLRLSGTVF